VFTSTRLSARARSCTASCGPPSHALVLLSATTLVGIALAPWVLRAIAPGFTSDPRRRRSRQLTRVMFPYLVLVACRRWPWGALNAENRFFASALGPAVSNVGMIAGVLLLARHVDPPILALALGVLVGGVGQLLVQVPDLARAGSWSAHRGSPGTPRSRRMARLLARRSSAGGGAGDGLRQHAARLVPAGRLDLLPLLRRPGDGVPARPSSASRWPRRRCRDGRARRPPATRARWRAR